MHIHVLAWGSLGSPQLWLWVENYTMGNMFDYESLLVIFCSFTHRKMKSLLIMETTLLTTKTFTNSSRHYFMLHR